MEEGVYQFFISKISDTPSPNDPLVRETIAVIIREFFAIKPVVILYICDTSDARQSVRDRLFARWFEEYSNNKEYTMIHESIMIDGITYYGSLLMKSDHPIHDEICSRFHDFVINLSSKLNSY